MLTEAVFSGTTVDAAVVHGYLLSVNLGYYETACRQGEDEQTLGLFNHVEVFEIHFRRYLAGTFKTLHTVLADVRLFLAYNPDGARGMVRLIIGQIRHHFLKHEWYELIPRFEKAVIRIESLLTIAVGSSELV